MGSVLQSFQAKSSLGWAAAQQNKVENDDNEIGHNFFTPERTWHH